MTRPTRRGDAHAKLRPSVLAAVLALLVFAGSAWTGCQRRPPDGPSMPFEDEGACPFKGCRYGEWIATSGVAVKADRWIGAPVRFRLRKGDRALALTGVVVTHRPGRVHFRTPVDLSTSTGGLHVNPEDTLYLLTDQGEGVTTAWFKGQVYRDVEGSGFLNPACEQTPGACNGAVVEKPLYGWWVQVRNAQGLIGWTNQPERFDNRKASR